MNFDAFIYKKPNIIFNTHSQKQIGFHKQVTDNTRHYEKVATTRSKFTFEHIWYYNYTLIREYLNARNGKQFRPMYVCMYVLSVKKM